LALPSSKLMISRQFLKFEPSFEQILGERALSLGRARFAMTMFGLSMITEQALASDAGREDQLVMRLQRAEPSAVAEVYDAHHAAVRAFAKRLLGDAATAEDLVHEVFVSLPQAVRKFRGDSALRTFLISIAVNHARHHVRAAQRRRRATSSYGELGHDPPRDPEHEARRKELAYLLTRALTAWDAYLAAAPRGQLAPEARYNRALSLVRLGRIAEARAALAPFANGPAGGYRRAEAAALLERLSD